MIHFNAVPWANAAVVGALLCVGCSSSNATKASQGDGDAGSNDGSGTAGAGDTTVGGQAAGTEGGAGANAGGEGSVQGAGGAGGAPGTLGATAHGHIDLVQSQIASAFHYTLQGGFVRYADAVAPANGIMCTASTIGDCLVSACTITEVADPGTPPVGTVLDAGLLTVTGAGASKAALKFGTVSPKSTQPGYPAVSADKQFFSGGDSIELVGAGGADLPAFKAQKLIAPNEIVLTAPACSGASCPDVDRSKDLTVAWTAGGAGNLKASFETVGDTATAYVFCTFEAAAGTGTVPKAALAQLGDTRDGTTTGIELFASENETTFDVADVPTTFSLQISGIQALMTISK
jgi:hypothetical protein